MVTGSGMSYTRPLIWSLIKQKTIILDFISPADYPLFATRTNLRLGDATKPDYPELSSASRLEGISFDNYSGVTGAAYQMEGVAWENDKVGFPELHGPAKRNGYFRKAYRGNGP